MPSILVGVVSGGQLMVSGTLTSGRQPKPQGGIQLKAASNNSGNVYVALSGNMTINSGLISAAGVASGGNMDGVALAPGDAYWVPAGAMTVSGAINVFLGTDAASSGTARIYYEIY
jgi:hypothetical protein